LVFQHPAYKDGFKFKLGRKNVLRKNIISRRIVVYYIHRAKTIELAKYLILIYSGDKYGTNRKIFRPFILSIIGNSKLLCYDSMIMNKFVFNKI